MAAPSENSTGPENNGKMERNINEYFTVNPEEIKDWTYKERESLLEISDDILAWSPGEEGNIFLINSYEEKKRNRAAAFIARQVGSKRIWPIFITKAGQLGKSIREIEGTSREVAFFISLSERGPLSEKDLPKILMHLGARKYKDIPIVLALPDRYESIFEQEEDKVKISYPQNSASRAFIMLGIAILVTPLFNLPYMHLPLGNNFSVDDAGIIELSLFLYSMVLFAASRKKVARKQAYFIFISIFFFLTSIFAEDSIILPGVPVYFGSPILTSFLSVNLIGFPPLWTENFTNAIYFSIPVFFKLLSFALLPLGFAQNKRKTTLTILVISFVMVYLSMLFFSSRPILATPVHYGPLVFQSYFPPLETFYSYPGDTFLEALAGIPVATMFFADYVRTSFNLKEKFYEPREAAVTNPEPV